MTWTQDESVLALGLVVREVKQAVHDLGIVLLSSPLFGLVSQFELQRRRSFNIVAYLLQRLLANGRSRIVDLVASKLHLIVPQL